MGLERIICHCYKKNSRTRTTCYCPKRREEVLSELCLRCSEFVGDSGCTYEKKAYWRSKKR